MAKKNGILKRALDNTDQSHIPPLFRDELPRPADGEMDFKKLKEVEFDPFTNNAIPDQKPEMQIPESTNKVPKKRKVTPKQTLPIVPNPGHGKDGDMQVIYGTVPSKSNCYKIISFGPKEKRMYSLGKTADLTKYEKSFFIQCNKYRNANIDGYFEFKIDVYYPNQRSDLDNSLKVVLDCLQKGVKAITNDNRCVDIHARKFLDTNHPRIEFKIVPL